jgi:hypothetical protein
MLAAYRLEIFHSSVSHAAELAKHPRVNADDGPALWPASEHADVIMRDSTACSSIHLDRLGSGEGAHLALLACHCVVARRSCFAPVSSQPSRTARLRQRTLTVSVEAAGKVLYTNSCVGAFCHAGQGMGYEAQGAHPERAGGPERYTCSRSMHERTLERDRELRSAIASSSEPRRSSRGRYKTQGCE